jgi:hypothetical protein
MPADQNQLPGSEYIGFGFNALETYDLSSVTTQLFALQGPTTTWEDPISHITYTVPANMNPTSESESSTETFVFEGEEAVSQEFAAMAKIATSGSWFSGEFDATYGSLQMHDAAYYYAMVRKLILLWGVQIQNTGIDYLSQSFTGSPIVEGLPATFTSQNQNEFYELFDNFGTHFISHVDVGGRLDYLCAVSQQSNHSEEEVKAKAHLEFQAFFSDTEVEANGFWKQVGTDWASSRKGLIRARGGDFSTIDSLAFPSYGQYKPHVLTEWTQSVRTSPGLGLIKLRPLSVLFSGAQARAIDEALTHYARDSISVAAETAAKLPAATIHVFGKALRPPVAPKIKYDAFTWLVLIDDEGNVLLNESALHAPEKVIEAAEPVAAAHPNCWLGLAVSGMPGVAYPNSQSVSFLETFGATLAHWREDLGNSAPPGIAYACVGRQSWPRGKAKESYTYAMQGAGNQLERVEAAALTHPRADRSLRKARSEQG